MVFLRNTRIGPNIWKKQFNLLQPTLRAHVRGRARAGGRAGGPGVAPRSIGRRWMDAMQDG
jgi:hypothetical protein